MNKNGIIGIFMVWSLIVLLFIFITGIAYVSQKFGDNVVKVIMVVTWSACVSWLGYHAFSD